MNNFSVYWNVDIIISIKQKLFIAGLVCYFLGSYFSLKDFIWKCHEFFFLHTIVYVAVVRYCLDAIFSMA